MHSSPPTNKFSRGKVVGKALLKIGATQTKSFVKRSLGHKNIHTNIKEQTHEEIADVIFEALGELKGVSVKIAQQIALGMPFLPPAYIEKISKTFKIKKGPLMIVSKDCKLSKAMNNLVGVDVCLVKNINAELLAPGANLGRLTIWSEGAIEKIAKEKLFI